MHLLPEWRYELAHLFSAIGIWKRTQKGLVGKPFRGTRLWWRWLTEDAFIPHREFRMDSSQQMSGDVLALLPEDQGVCAVLDVGSGPLSGIGALAPGKLINLYLTGALAREYNKMLNRLGIGTAVRPLPVEAEELTTVFPDDYFDLLVCFNALDHTHDPIGAIREMVAVCKPGCWIFPRPSQQCRSHRKLRWVCTREPRLLRRALRRVEPRGTPRRARQRSGHW